MAIYIVVEARTDGLVAGAGTIPTTATGEATLTAPVSSYALIALRTPKETDTVIDTLTGTGDGITLRVLHAIRLRADLKVAISVTFLREVTCVADANTCAGIGSSIALSVTRAHTTQAVDIALLVAVQATVLGVAHASNPLRHNSAALTAQVLAGAATIAIRADGARRTCEDASCVGVGIADTLASGLATHAMEVAGGGGATWANACTRLSKVSSGAATHAPNTTAISITQEAVFKSAGTFPVAVYATVPIDTLAGGGAVYHLAGPLPTANSPISGGTCVLARITCIARHADANTRLGLAGTTTSTHQP
eukprot:TRINITY_DN13315_c0_g1_i1.p2 TRINITY_DN13315_c0_g1~~TRINITY_DN13315_c0_g1_i1.p2  ORF type:complete len:309 (-),score=-1.72 TRINITY_DN13315_c0_g1_i1:1078-2004(-)